MTGAVMITGRGHPFAIQSALAARACRATASTGGALNLGAPLMRFELAGEAERLRGERQYAEGDRNAATLAKIDWFRLTLVALQGGATFSETDQRGSVALQTLEGRVTVSVADQTADIGRGELAVVAPGQPWEAVAMAESLLLVHLAWPPEPASAAI